MKNVAEREATTATPVLWVATNTFCDEYRRPGLYEEGGIYDHKPYSRGFDGSRQLVPGEREALCPRCGARFVATDGNTAEENRDVHVNGDEDIPSICL